MSAKTLQEISNGISSAKAEFEKNPDNPNEFSEQFKDSFMSNMSELEGLLKGFEGTYSEFAVKYMENHMDDIHKMTPDEQCEFANELCAGIGGTPIDEELSSVKSIISEAQSLSFEKNSPSDFVNCMDKALDKISEIESRHLAPGENQFFYSRIFSTVDSDARSSLENLPEGTQEKLADGSPSAPMEHTDNGIRAKQQYYMQPNGTATDQFGILPSGDMITGKIINDEIIAHPSEANQDIKDAILNLADKINDMEGRTVIDDDQATIIATALANEYYGIADPQNFDTEMFDKEIKNFESYVQKDINQSDWKDAVDIADTCRDEFKDFFERNGFEYDDVEQKFKERADEANAGRNTDNEQSGGYKAGNNDFGKDDAESKNSTGGQGGRTKSAGGTGNAPGRQDVEKAAAHGDSGKWVEENTGNETYEKWAKVRNEMADKYQVSPRLLYNDPTYVYANLVATFEAYGSGIEVKGEGTGTVPTMFECLGAYQQLINVNVLEFAVTYLVASILEAIFPPGSEAVDKDANDTEKMHLALLDAADNSSSGKNDTDNDNPNNPPHGGGGDGGNDDNNPPGGGGGGLPPSGGGGGGGLPPAGGGGKDSADSGGKNGGQPGNSDVEQERNGAIANPHTEGNIDNGTENAGASGRTEKLNFDQPALASDDSAESDVSEADGAIGEKNEAGTEAEQENETAVPETENQEKDFEEKSAFETNGQGTNDNAESKAASKENNTDGKDNTDDDSKNTEKGIEATSLKEGDATDKNTDQSKTDIPVKEPATDLDKEKVQNSADSDGKRQDQPNDFLSDENFEKKTDNENSDPETHDEKTRDESEKLVENGKEEKDKEVSAEEKEKPDHIDQEEHAQHDIEDHKNETELKAENSSPEKQIDSSKEKDGEKQEDKQEGRLESDNKEHKIDSGDEDKPKDADAENKKDAVAENADADEQKQADTDNKPTEETSAVKEESEMDHKEAAADSETENRTDADADPEKAVDSATAPQSDTANSDIENEQAEGEQAVASGRLDQNMDGQDDAKTELEQQEPEEKQIQDETAEPSEPVVKEDDKTTPAMVAAGENDSGPVVEPEEDKASSEFRAASGSTTIGESPASSEDMEARAKESVDNDGTMRESSALNDVQQNAADISIAEASGNSDDVKSEAKSSDQKEFAEAVSNAVNDYISDPMCSFNDLLNETIDVNGESMTIQDAFANIDGFSDLFVSAISESLADYQESGGGNDTEIQAVSDLIADLTDYEPEMMDMVFDNAADLLGVDTANNLFDQISDDMNAYSTDWMDADGTSTGFSPDMLDEAVNDIMGSIYSDFDNALIGIEDLNYSDSVDTGLEKNDAEIPVSADDLARAGQDAVENMQYASSPFDSSDLAEMAEDNSDYGNDDATRENVESMMSQPTYVDNQEEDPSESQPKDDSSHDWNDQNTYNDDYDSNDWIDIAI